MSCPDWPALLAVRAADPAVDPPEWRAARAHLDDCVRCRENAFALDPTLVFSRLAVPRLATDEVQRMRQAVEALRRAEPLRHRRHRRRPSARALRRGALAAGLLIAALGQHPLAFVPPSAPLVAPSPSVATPVAIRPAESAGSGLASIVDQLDRPQARIYEMGAEGLSVIMIVDESLDV